MITLQNDNGLLLGIEQDILDRFLNQLVRINDLFLVTGKVLIVGGENNTSFLASAELYEPATRTFTPTGSMSIERRYHTATLLANGKVLIAGGQKSDGTALASAELYDPATGTFTVTRSMGAARTWHTATLLPNGKVLIAGGEGDNPHSAEVYDTTSETFYFTSSMSVARYFHSATLLPDGKVLIAAGGHQFSAELYDPPSGTFTATGDMPNVTWDGVPAATLPNGQTLFANAYISTLYTASTGAFTRTGILHTARQCHTATTLLNGTVLVAGGFTGGSAPYSLASAELFQ